MKRSSLYLYSRSGGEMANRRIADIQTTDFDAITSIASFEEYKQVNIQTAFGPTRWSAESLLTIAKPTKVVKITT